MGAGDLAAAQADLDGIVADIARDRDELSRGVDHSFHYESAGLLADVGAALAAATDSARAREMFGEAVAEAGKVGEWDVYPFVAASHEDSSPFAVFGSGIDNGPAGSNPLSEHYVYVRGLALHEAACAAEAAGTPVAPERLRLAAFSAEQQEPYYSRQYGVRLWVRVAVALSLAQRGCAPEDGAIPPRRRRL